MAFNWMVQRGLGPLPVWTLVIVAGDVSIARRYYDELPNSEAQNEAKKVASAMARLIEERMF